MTRPEPISQPDENMPAMASRQSAQTLDVLAQRRSTSLAKMGEPGPSLETLRDIARLAARVPDHGKLGPWRFLALTEAGRLRAGEAIAAALQGAPEMDPARLEIERTRFLRAPACLVVISTAGPHAKIPEWEQQLSAGAVCFAALLAGHAMGYAGTWLTETPAYEPDARAALGLTPHERIAGFIYFGTAVEPVTERVRPDFPSRFASF